MIEECLRSGRSPAWDYEDTRETVENKLTSVLADCISEPLRTF